MQPMVSKPPRMARYGPGLASSAGGALSVEALDCASVRAVMASTRLLDPWTLDIQTRMGMLYANEAAQRTL